MLFFRFLMIAALLPVSTSHNGWSVVGPGGGGAMFHPTVSPHDPNRVLVGCDMTGSYLSEDGGKSWKMFNLRGPARFFLFDPSDPKVAYAQTIGLWRSSDAGHTWSMVYPANAVIEADGDHADERVMGKDQAIDALRPVFADVAPGVLRMELIAEAAGRLRLDPSVMGSLIDHVAPRAPGGRPTGAARPGAARPCWWPARRSAPQACPASPRRAAR